MKKFWCVFFVLMFLVVSANVLVADEGTDDQGGTDQETMETTVDVDGEGDLQGEETDLMGIDDYEKQSVRSQLEVVTMALGVADEDNTDTTTSEPTGDDDTQNPDNTEPVLTDDDDDEGTSDMDAVAERHAFIAWAHYNHVPPSRKLQEYLSTPVTELVQDFEVNESGEEVPKVDEEGNPVMIENTTSSWNWEAIKEQVLAGDYSFVSNVSVPDGLKSAANPDGANWGQFKKTLEVQTATMVKANSQNKGKSNNGKSDEKGNNGKGGENGNKGGNGKGKGKNK